jgi:hypothetical protein
MYRRSPLRILISGILLVVAIGFGISKAVRNVGEAKNGIEQSSGGGNSGAGAGDSLIRSQNLAKAIAAVKGKGATEVLELRLEPGEAKFQVRDGDGAKGWSYTRGGDLSDFKVNLIGPGRIQDNVFPIARLSAGTPERIVARIHAKAPQFDLADVQFMTLEVDAASGKFEWSVNIGKPGSGRLYQADLNGGNVRSPGELPAGGTAGAPPKTGTGVADCIAKAAGDVTKIQACAGQ